MKWLSLAWICLLLLAGCRHPFKTESIVRVPDGVSGRVQMELPGQTDAGPMLEVPISSASCAGAPAQVAVIDLDGILCNLNYVGPFAQGENPLAAFKERLASAAANPNVC